MQNTGFKPYNRIFFMKLTAEDRETTVGRSILRRNWYYLQAARGPYPALLGLFGINVSICKY
jgi:hypothetical protein